MQYPRGSTATVDQGSSALFLNQHVVPCSGIPAFGGDVDGELDPENGNQPETAPGRELPTWFGQRVDEGGHDDELVEADRWIEAAEARDAAQTSPTHAVFAGQPMAASEPDAGPVPGVVAQPGPAAGAASSVPVPTGRQRRAAALLFGAVVLIGLVGFAGWALGRTSVSPVEIDSIGNGNTAAEMSETDTADDGLAAGDENTGTAPDDDTTGIEEPAVTSTVTTVVAQADAAGPFVVPDTPDNPSGATQYAVMADGKAVMRGWYPTEELASMAVADAAAIMGGMENVLDETEVDPRAEIRPDDFAVYLQDFVLFEFDSAEITPEFYEFLGFPLFFMQSSPAATVTVVARTDARGSESYNLDLATRRAEAVRDYWLANGGNADQIILDPRGEEEADEDADDQQAALDRRVELRVSGFLAG